LKKRYQVIIRDKKTGSDTDLEYFLNNKIEEIQEKMKQLSKQLTILTHIQRCNQVDQI